MITMKYRGWHRWSHIYPRPSQPGESCPTLQIIQKVNLGDANCIGDRLICVWMFTSIFGMVVELKLMSKMDSLVRKKYIGMCRWSLRSWPGWCAGSQAQQSGTWTGAVCIWESEDLLFWKPQRKKFWNYCTVLWFMLMWMTIRKEKMFMTNFYIWSLLLYPS
jgi:hypothetical protein